MKIISGALLMITVVAGLAACKKSDSGTPATTCTIIINDTLTIIPDSVHWDYLGANARMQAFTKGEATFTLWPQSTATGNYSLGYQYVYWIFKTGIYSPQNVAPGTLQLTNNNGVLSGSMSATGTLFNGTGPSTGKMTATFANVRKI